MIRKTGGFILVGLIVFSCGTHSNEQNNDGKQKEVEGITSMNSDCASYFKQAQQADSVLMVATTMNTYDAEKALVAFSNFASFCKTDSLAPIFLLKGGELAQSIKKYTQAQSLLKKCTDEFPKFKNRGAALFLLAQLYDDASMLNNEQEAKTIYEQIIKEYPQSVWADNAKACIANLGKTDEQLVQEFLKKNKGH